MRPRSRPPEDLIVVTRPALFIATAMPGCRGWLHASKFVGVIEEFGRRVDLIGKLAARKCHELIDELVPPRRMRRQAYALANDDVGVNTKPRGLGPAIGVIGITRLPCLRVRSEMSAGPLAARSMRMATGR